MASKLSNKLPRTVTREQSWTLGPPKSTEIRLAQAREYQGGQKQSSLDSNVCVSGGRGGGAYTSSGWQGGRE